MGLFSTIKKAIGIAEMKADEALDDALSPVDKAKLNIKNKKKKLADARINYDKVREIYFIEKNKLARIEDDLEGLNAKKEKIIVAMNNFKNQGLTPDQIKAKVSKTFASITDGIQEKTGLITPQAQIVSTHKVAVEKFDSVIKVFEKELRKEENEVKILTSQYQIADTTSSIADAMNELNADGSADDIAQLRAKRDAKQAKADSMMDGVLSNQDVGDSLDDLILESSSGSSGSELDALLGFSEPKAISPTSELDALLA